MSKAIDEYLLNEMKEEDDHDLMMGYEINSIGEAIDAMMETESVNESIDEIFPQCDKFCEEKDYELKEIEGYHNSVFKEED